MLKSKKKVFLGNPRFVVPPKYLNYGLNSYCSDKYPDTLYLWTKQFHCFETSTLITDDLIRRDCYMSSSKMAFVVLSAVNGLLFLRNVVLKPYNDLMIIEF